MKRFSHELMRELRDRYRQLVFNTYYRTDLMTFKTLVSNLRLSDLEFLDAIREHISEHGAFHPFNDDILNPNAPAEKEWAQGRQYLLKTHEGNVTTLCEQYGYLGYFHDSDYTILFHIPTGNQLWGWKTVDPEFDTKLRDTIENIECLFTEDHFRAFDLIPKLEEHLGELVEDQVAPPRLTLGLPTGTPLYPA